MVGCITKNKHQHEMYWQEIALRAQSVLTILDVMVNIFGVTYMIIY